MAVPVVSSAAVTRLTASSAVVAPTPNPATPVSASSAAVTTTAAAAAATTSAAAPAAAAATSASSAAAAAAPAASSSDAARQPAPQASSASSSAAAVVAPAISSSASSASVSRSSSSAATSSSSASSASSSASASRSSSASIATGTVAIAGATDSNASTGNNGLSAGEIGGIAGGAAAGLIVLVIAFLCWRKKRRTRGERLPPPPPRDPMIGQTASVMRQRSSSGVLLGGTGGYRQSSQFGLLQSRPSDTSAMVSRTPSFYTTYPIATPSSGADISPPMEPQMVPLSDHSGTALPAETPSSTEDSDGPRRSMSPDRPKLAINTDLRRDDSSSSNEANGVPIGGGGPARARRIPSIDRLRNQAGVGGGSDRAPSPSSGFFPPPSGPPSEAGSSRATSPHPSQRGGGSSSHNNSGYPSPTPSTIGRFPRPQSMTSMSSHSKYLHIGPAGGAPHMGRPVQLKMPAPLSQDSADSMNSDFFPSMSRLESGSMAGYDSMRHMSRHSQSFYGQQQDFVPEMGGIPQRPMSTSQSLGNHRSSRSFQPGPPLPPVQHRSLNSLGGGGSGSLRSSVTEPRSPVDNRPSSRSQLAPQDEDSVDPRAVLGREQV